MLGFDRRHGSRWCCGIVLAGSGLLLGQPVVAQPPQAASAAAAPAEANKDKLAELHAKFARQLSGSTFVGHFTVDGQHANEMKEERYEIESVTKLPAGEMWLFKVRIRYGDHDVNVPLPLKVTWSAETPLIVVDQVTVPGLGTFDSRVIVAGERYAGTWQHGEVGGHLFGKIVSPAPAAPPATQSDAPDDAKK